MKNILFVLLAALFIVSCEDSQVNEVALQAKINNILYQAADARASIGDDGTLIIQGTSQDQSLIIKLTNLAENNFPIGEQHRNSAFYQDIGGNIFSTQPDGEGLVTISEVNEANMTLSGTFRFNAILPGVDTIYVSKGFLYNIPYNDGTILDPTNAGSFSAKIDDNEFIPISVNARNTGNNIIITASTINSTIALQFKPDVEAGDFTLPQSGIRATFTKDNQAQTTIGGLIIVSEHNTAEKTLKGTFRFNTDGAQITEGKFNITYQ